MHALLVSFGTDGDVYPYIGLGQRLRQRGHRVTLLSGERYQALAERSGFEFAALATEAETQQILNDPDLWHPWKCARVLARFGVAKLPDDHAAVLSHVTEDTVLVANPGVLAARTIHEQHGVPLVSIILQPWVIPSVTAPPIMPLMAPQWAPRFIRSGYWNVFQWAAHQVIGRDVNRWRGSLGLPPVPRVFKWWLSPERVLAMFPAWYGPPQSDWWPQLRLTGFPLFDGRMSDELPAEIVEFLAAGDPPVAVTFGTGMKHAAALFADTAKACESAGLRAMLLTRHLEQVPKCLPPTIRGFSFAPFRALFPNCAAVIHHGGIGTTSQALAAGTPQLILPFAFDQPDNGTRIERLGVGAWFRPGRNIAARIEAALRQITRPEVQSRCRAVAERFAGEDALECAAQEIEAAATIAADTRRETARV